MSSRCVICVVSFVILLCLTKSASAHEGPPFPLFVDQTVEGYTVSVWTDPDVGTALFFVIVNLPEPAQLPPDLRVQVGVQPANGRVPEVFYSTTRENLQGQTQYRAEVHFDKQELWRVRVRLESAAGNAETIATVEATPPGYGRWDLLLYVLPFVAIGLLWAVALLRKIKQRVSQ